MLLGFGSNQLCGLAGFYGALDAVLLVLSASIYILCLSVQRLGHGCREETCLVACAVSLAVIIVYTV